MLRTLPVQRQASSSHSAAHCLRSSFWHNKPPATPETHTHTHTLMREHLNSIQKQVSVLTENQSLTPVWWKSSVCSFKRSSSWVCVCACVRVCMHVCVCVCVWVCAVSLTHFPSADAGADVLQQVWFVVFTLRHFSVFLQQFPTLVSHHALIRWIDVLWQKHVLKPDSQSLRL